MFATGASRDRNCQGLGIEELRSGSKPLEELADQVFAAMIEHIPVHHILEGRTGPRLPCGQAGYISG